MKIKLTSGQMNALRYAERGELVGTLDDGVCSTDSQYPKTAAARRLYELGLVQQQRVKGERPRIVATLAGARVLAAASRNVEARS